MFETVILPEIGSVPKEFHLREHPLGGYLIRSDEGGGFGDCASSISRNKKCPIDFGVNDRMVGVGIQALHSLYNIVYCVRHFWPMRVVVEKSRGELDGLPGRTRAKWVLHFNEYKTYIIKNMRGIYVEGEGESAIGGQWACSLRAKEGRAASL